MAERTILVVDDDEIQLEGLSVVLSRDGYTVHKARNPEEALTLLDSLIPDLILLDMMYPTPKYDGWYFFEELRKKPTAESVPVIITTAIRVASQEWAMSLGAKGLLQKPIDVQTLLAEVRRFLPATTP